VKVWRRGPDSGTSSTRLALPFSRRSGRAPRWRAPGRRCRRTPLALAPAGRRAPSRSRDPGTTCCRTPATTACPCSGRTRGSSGARSRRRRTRSTSASSTRARLLDAAVAVARVRVRAAVELLRVRLDVALGLAAWSRPARGRSGAPVDVLPDRRRRPPSCSRGSAAGRRSSVLLQAEADRLLQEGTASAPGGDGVDDVGLGAWIFGRCAENSGLPSGYGVLPRTVPPSLGAGRAEHGVVLLAERVVGVDDPPLLAELLDAEGGDGRGW
jgi:hypothetical protein